MVNLKPNKPESFAGKRDSVTVNAWLYQVEKHLNLLQMSSPDMLIDGSIRLSFASTLLSGNAAKLVVFVGTVRTDS